MARRRLGALLATGGVRLCGVAARHRESAARLADEFGGADAFDDYRLLAGVRPEIVLIETPHDVQDSAASWAVAQGCHVLLGGPLATSVVAGQSLGIAARARGLIVEAGFEARYAPVWEAARDIVDDGRLGILTAGQATALWPADPASWYYDEAASGGMPLTHMSYCFINPLRWLFGEPRVAGAAANRRVRSEAGRVMQESCVALLDFGGLPISLTAGYVRAADHGAWRVRLFGSAATLDIDPDEDGPGRLAIRRGAAVERVEFTPASDAFERQAQVFLAAIAGDDRRRNAPEACLGDLRTIRAIRDATRFADAAQMAQSPLGEHPGDP